MKTFETEKHNIPEGATGYREQGDYIEWFSGEPGCWRLIASNVPSLDMCNTSKHVKQIQQTNIETTEEKEALDLIDTTPHQYEMSKFSVVAAKYTDVDGEIFEQVDFDKTILTIDGDICIESDLHFAWSNKNIVPVSDVTGRDLLMNRHKLCKRIESPQQREKREWIEKFAHKVKHVGTMTYKEILGEMYDSLKGESK